MAAESLLQVVELFPGPALVVGPGGEILGANDRAGRWIGPGRDQLVGRPLARFVSDPPERVDGFLEECARDGRKVAGTLTLARGGGAGGECQVEGISVQARPGGGDSTLVVVHVLSGEPDDGARVAAGGEDALEALREEVRRRDEFLDRLAHDLRNPVAAISGALYVARKATAPADVAWAEDAMERQLKHLARQLDDLLDLSRIARGKVELNRQPLDAATVARGAAASVRPLIDERHHQLTFSTSPGGLEVDADPARLEQLLAGVLGHVAGSAAPGGRIRLSVGREEDAIVFRVRDEGKDPSFATSPRAADRPAPGDASEGEQGIGLMLVRKLAEMHGGSACVRREGPGGRSEFTIRLPVASDRDGSEAEPAGGAHPAGPAGARILVVDDNVDAARGTARLLQIAGHDVRVAHDGRQALEMAHGHRPQFILLDIALPGMDGYEVARQLRGDPRHRGATIIAISGYSEEDYRHLEAGTCFDHHLVKPVGYDALRAVLGRPAGGMG
jgi:signal transduction histidine kinase/CheY-like chemotaxis protein